MLENQAFVTVSSCFLPLYCQYTSSRYSISFTSRVLVHAFAFTLNYSCRAFLHFENCLHWKEEAGGTGATSAAKNWFATCVRMLQANSPAICNMHMRTLREYVWMLKSKIEHELKQIKETIFFLGILKHRNRIKRTHLSEWSWQQVAHENVPSPERTKETIPPRRIEERNRSTKEAQPQDKKHKTRTPLPSEKSSIKTSKISL